MKRREFIILAASCLGVACQREQNTETKSINLGHITNINQGTTFFKLERVAIIRSADSFKAISLICTHQHCMIKEASAGLICPCHGSEFDSNGRVLKGPATRNLDNLKLSSDSQANLIVYPEIKVPADWSYTIA